MPIASPVQSVLLLAGVNPAAAWNALIWVDDIVMECDHRLRCTGQKSLQGREAVLGRGTCSPANLVGCVRCH